MKKYLFWPGVGVIVFALVVLAVVWRPGAPAAPYSGKVDPFAGLVYPSGLDADTRAVMEEKVSSTKAMYERDPDIWETWIAIGNLRQLLGDRRGAIAAYEQSLKLQENNVLGNRNMAEVYVQLGDYEKAARNFELAIGRNFADPDLYLKLALLYEQKLNRPDLAEVTYRQGLNYAAQNREYLSSLAAFYKQQGKWEQYREYARELVQAYPEDGSLKEVYRDALE